ncbi:MAG: phosphodiester glycosidase family protein [Ferruginibacter sp.]
MYKYCLAIFFIFSFSNVSSQVKWKNVDSLYQPLPSSMHVYFTNEKLDTGAFRAYYLVADLKDKQLDFTTDTTFKRRLTPQQFFEKNNKPLLVINGTFFSFETNQNLNVVVKDGHLLGYNVRQARSKTDTTKFINEPMTRGVIGIDKKRNADIAWISADSTMRFPNAYEAFPSADTTVASHKWKMKTAIGGGPVLLQNGNVVITNNQEKMFAGKAINDKHPRTCIGYTADHKIIIMVIEGRNEKGSGATLIQEAKLLQDLSCIEGLNLDGGGSSCMLINGKPTINVSDKTGQRPVPAVFIIKRK